MLYRRLCWRLWSLQHSRLYSSRQLSIQLHFTKPNHLSASALNCLFQLDFSIGNVYFFRLPPPASKEAIQKLPEVTVESDNKSCPICLKNFSAGDKAKEMPCHHQFHANCILTWLERVILIHIQSNAWNELLFWLSLFKYLFSSLQTNSCPFCRHELPTDNEGYEAFKKEKKRAEQRKEDIDALHNSMFSWFHYLILS